MKPLVEWYEGEPWFDNPLLTIANPRQRKRAGTTRKRRSKTMARARRRGRKHSPRRRARRNFYSAGVLANPRRRRRSLRHNRRRARRSAFALNRRRRRVRRNVYTPLMNRKRHRRHYRSNPLGGGKSFMGIPIPPLDAVLWVGAGIVVPNALAPTIISFVPSSLTSSYPQATAWGAKVLAVVGPSMLVKRFVSPRAGNLMLIGGAVSLTLDLLRTFAPGMIPGLSGFQPLLGSYFTRPVQGNIRAFPAQSGVMKAPPLLASTPDRLDPTGRF